MGGAAHARARNSFALAAPASAAPALTRDSPSVRSLAFSGAAVADARTTASTLHVAPNSGGSGGLLPVLRSAGCNLDVCSLVPTAGERSKVGFPVRPKICVLSQRWRQG